tara:strand:- start:1891 stop:2070 length:180 start_codon:yes stop_codon:yes gene_type:complete
MTKFDRPQYITTEHAKSPQKETDLNTFIEIYIFQGHKIKSMQQDNGKYFTPEYIDINLN